MNTFGEFGNLSLAAIDVEGISLSTSSYGGGGFVFSPRNFLLTEEQTVAARKAQTLVRLRREHLERIRESDEEVFTNNIHATTIESHFSIKENHHIHQQQTAAVQCSFISNSSSNNMEGEGINRLHQRPTTTAIPATDYKHSQFNLLDLQYFIKDNG